MPEGRPAASAPPALVVPAGHANHYFFTSLTRISDLRATPFETERVAREEWRNGDYVVCEVENKSRIPLELSSGRDALVAPGDRLVGALGRRSATLEAVGSFEAVGDDLKMHALTGAGLLGRATSVSAMLPTLIGLRYVGHVVVGGTRVGMSTYRPEAGAARYTHPVVLIVGTSMSAGKTTTARVIVRTLKEDGYRVIGAKLTGAGRYRDILAMKDAGADHVFDFVDAGLPSTVCPEDEFVEALDGLLRRMGSVPADVVVAEAGASPLEPYNGAAVLRLLHGQVRCIFLCAADPYSVVGVQQAFALEPDIVCGLATSTSAGVELVEALSGLRAIDVLDPTSRTVLRQVLESKLERK